MVESAWGAVRATPQASRWEESTPVENGSSILHSKIVHGRRFRPLVAHGQRGNVSVRGAGTATFRGNGTSNSAGSPLARRRFVAGKRPSGSSGGGPIPSIAYAKPSASARGVKNNGSEFGTAIVPRRTQPAVLRHGLAALGPRHRIPRARRGTPPNPARCHATRGIPKIFVIGQVAMSRHASRRAIPRNTARMLAATRCTGCGTGNAAGGLEEGADSGIPS